MTDNPIKILLVEDDPREARLVRKMLAEAQGHAFDVECADRLSAALKRARRDAVDVVLLDLFLGESRGVETLKKVLGVAPRVPVLAITSLDDEESGVDAIRQGAQDYLVKGKVDSALLVRAIRCAIERTGIEKSLREGRNQLEARVREATAELVYANKSLQCEIAERKRAEQRLRLLSSAVEQSTEGIAVADLEGNLVFVNEAFASMHGYAVSELARKHLSVLHTPEQMPSVEAANQQVQQTGQFSGELAHVRKNGEAFPAAMRNSLLRDGDGNPIGLIKTHRDITEQKRASLCLQREHEAIISVVNSMFGGKIDDRHTEERILEACLAATDSVYGMIGAINEHGRFDTTTYNTRTLQDCAFPEALAWEMSTEMAIRGIWGSPMLHGKPVVCNDLNKHPDRVGHPKGHVPIECFLGVPLKDGAKVVGMVAVANKPGGYTSQDKDTLSRLASVISVSRQHRIALEAEKSRAELEHLVGERTKELKAAQRQLVRKEKLAVLGQLAGGIAHELRNPLGAIKNSVYFLNMALEEPHPEVKESLEILNKEVADCERIISSILQFARPKPPTRRKVGLRALVEKVLASLEIPDNIDVVSRLDRALPTILADREQLGIVFGNIALNAIQAMPNGGRLEVTSRRQGAHRVAVSFSDTGLGLPKQNADTVFEPLFTTKAKGIGLGLAVARALVEGHGGTIEADDRKPKGATFAVTLPVRKTEAREHGS